MTGRYLTDLAEVCRSAGVEVEEVEGWEYRARGSGGYGDGRPWAVMWHHTASNTTPANDVNYICYGNPDAPVANLYIDRDGVVWVCAGGATNTNGKGGPVTVSRGTVPLDQMNTYAVSMELANTGTGEPWPRVQIDSAFAVSLAVARAYGLEADDALSHAGWCEPSCPGRKIDPATADAVQGPWRPRSINSAGTWSQDDLRAELRRRAAPTPPPIEEDQPMYLATLSDGTVCVVGSAVRPVSGDEIGPGGPFADLPRYTPDPASYWHQWLAAGVAEYSSRVKV
jgi:hypothetical protein